MAMSPKLPVELESPAVEQNRGLKNLVREAVKRAATIAPTTKPSETAEITRQARYKPKPPPSSLR